MSVGTNIRRRRMALGLSQAYVAEQAGVSQPMINQIERGTKNPSLQASAGIAKALQCKIEDFLEGEAED